MAGSAGEIRRSQGRLMETARISLQGDRSNNQDRCAIFNYGQSCLMVLADGLGGHPRGEVAAQIMLNVCEQLFTKTPKPISSPQFFFHHCVAHAHKLINQYGQSQDPVITPRTTVVMALIQDGNCYWSYAGDSRFYLLRDVTTHPYQHRAVPKRPFEWRPADCIPDLPWSAGNWRCGN
ncbi:PP2C family protein-serine/threonine phosphatase, partial [Thiolapillus sp.]